MNYKSMTDSELAGVMVNYIDDVSTLLSTISEYLKNTHKKEIQPASIKNEYKRLKEEFHNADRYLSLKCNQEGSDLYTAFFAPSIQEAAAEGFNVSSSSQINYAMYSTVNDALYKLTKYYSADRWRKLI